MFTSRLEVEEKTLLYVFRLKAGWLPVRRRLGFLTVFVSASWALISLEGAKLDVSKDKAGGLTRCDFVLCSALIAGGCTWLPSSLDCNTSTPFEAIFFFDPALEVERKRLETYARYLHQMAHACMADCIAFLKTYEHDRIRQIKTEACPVVLLHVLVSTS